MKKLKIITTAIFIVILSWSIITRVIESFGKVPIKNILIVLLILFFLIFLLVMKVTATVKNKKLINRHKDNDTLN